MKILYLDLYRQYLTIKPEINKVIQSTISGSKFVGGEPVDAFEHDFAEYIGTKYCISVNSGTDALILGIRALEFPENSEIIVPDNTFIATALSVSENRLKPVFADIDPADYGISLVDLKNKITPNTRAVIMVHLYGRPDKIDEVKQIIKQSGRHIDIIEDACQAHGAVYKSKRVGNFGIFSTFSFYPGKNLGAYGDGGAILTNDERLSRKLRLLKEYGSERKYYHLSKGINSRLDSMQAAILRVKLRYLDKWNLRRQEIARFYYQGLKHNRNIYMVGEGIDRKSIYHIFPIEVNHRATLREKLKKSGVETLIHYPLPLHLQEAYRELGYKKGDFPVTEDVAGKILSIPIYPELTEQQIEYIVKKINALV